jgi:multiple sugar transport system permease protein
MNLSKPHISLARRESLAGYAFVTPWVIGFFFLTLGPMLASLYFSFTQYNIVDPPIWIGLANYAKIFAGIPQALSNGDASKLGDPLFWKSLQVTLYYAMIALPLGLVLSFALAVLLNQKIPGVNFWRTVFYLPAEIAGVAVTVLWMRILNPRGGLLNTALEKLGILSPRAGGNGRKIA